MPCGTVSRPKAPSMSASNSASEKRERPNGRGDRLMRSSVCTGRLPDNPLHGAIKHRRRGDLPRGSRRRFSQRSDRSEPVMQSSVQSVIEAVFQNISCKCVRRREAYVLAYIDAFWLVAWVSVLGILFALLLRRPPPNPLTPPRRPS
jgi:hypothetical protein